MLQVCWYDTKENAINPVRLAQWYACTLLSCRLVLVFCRETQEARFCADVSMVPGPWPGWSPGGWDALVAGKVMRRRNITTGDLPEYSQTSVRCFPGFKRT